MNISIATKEDVQRIESKLDIIIQLQSKEVVIGREAIAQQLGIALSTFDKIRKKHNPACIKQDCKAGNISAYKIELEQFKKQYL